MLQPFFHRDTAAYFFPEFLQHHNYNFVKWFQFQTIIPTPVMFWNLFKKKLFLTSQGSHPAFARSRKFLPFLQLFHNHHECAIYSHCKDWMGQWFDNIGTFDIQTVDIPRYRQARTNKHEWVVNMELFESMEKKRFFARVIFIFLK